MEFQPFAPDQADDAQWREVHDSRVRVNLHDWPENEPPTFEATVARFRTGPEAMYPESLWLARDGDGEVVASAIYTTFGDENPHLAAVNISVHPDRRGRGIGTAFLRALVPHARQDGRTALMGMGVQEGADEKWATTLGFRPVVRMAYQQLRVAATDPALWDVATPPGYRLATWTDAVPEELLASYARARNAMHDAVTGDMSWQETVHTPESVRREEAAATDRGTTRWTLVAVDEADGEITGATSVDFTPGNPAVGFQGDTSVVRAHRGHGLGRVMKAAMLRRLAAERPGLTEIKTQTADFEHMARINIGLGYRTTNVCSHVEAKLAEVERTLAERG